MPELVRTILEAVLAAPTACNFQPQRILLIDDDNSRTALNRVMHSRYYVPLAFLVCYDRRECWVRPMDAKSSGEIDAAIVTTHMMLQAADLGLGSIWVMYWDPERLKQEFRLSEHLEPVSLLIVGHKSSAGRPCKGHLSSKTWKTSCFEIWRIVKKSGRNHKNMASPGEIVHELYFPAHETQGQFLHEAVIPEGI